MKACSNPFRTACIQSLPYVGDIEGLWARFQDNGFRGALVGPRGTGKTTLLDALQPRIRARFPTCVRWVGRDGVLTPPLPSRLSWFGPKTALLIDGVEVCWQWPLFLQTRSAGAVLVTSHRPTRWPTLQEHRTDLPLLHHLLGQLGNEAKTLAPLAEELLVRHEGNIRAVFLSLYDHVAAMDAHPNA